jgi:hypothetical protein
MRKQLKIALKALPQSVKRKIKGRKVKRNAISELY